MSNAGTKYLILVLIITLFIFPSISCKRNKNTKDYGDTIIIGIFGKPEKIDPFISSSGISGSLIDIIFDSLIELTPKKEIQPRIAKNWKTSSDGKTWSFKLHDNIYFHDGKKLTAEDVKFTFDKLMNKKQTVYANALKYVREIRVINDYTVVIELSEYDHSLPFTLFSIGIAPKHVYNNSSKTLLPIGSGPFKLISNDASKIILENNHHYFRGKPFLDKVIIQLYPTQRANLSALAAGKVDMLFLLGPKDYGIINKLDSLKIYPLLDKVAYIIPFNNKHLFFQNSKVRKALNYGTNKDTLLQILTGGPGKIIATLSSLRSENRSHNIKPYSYDPKNALKILNELGWRDRNNDFLLDLNGKKFEFTVLVPEEFEFSQNIVRSVQQQLKEIGVNMKAETLNNSALIKKIFRDRNFDAVILSYTLRYDDISNYTLWHSSQIEEGYNFSGYSNPEVDRLLDIVRTSQDENERKEAYQKFQQVIHDDPPGIFLFWRDFAYAIDKRFRGIPDRPFEFFKNLPNVWVPKSEQKYANQE